MTSQEPPHHLSNITAVYRERFDKHALTQKTKVWRVICQSFLQKFIDPSDTVLDIGAGTCDFINNIACKKKYAVDVNPDIKNFASDDITVILTQQESSLGLDNESVDVVFASNFFEHLPDRQYLIDTLAEIRRVLKPNGRIIVIGPNVKYLYMHYWDFFDHQIAISHESMREALVASGFRIEILRARFLPYTFRSRFPKGAFFVKNYLRFRILQWIFGKQMLVIARKA